MEAPLLHIRMRELRVRPCPARHTASMPIDELAANVFGSGMDNNPSGSDSYGILWDSIFSIF